MAPTRFADWHILAGEYPPLPGGVSDYTRSIVEQLAAAGASVQVWTRSDAIEEDRVVQATAGIEVVSIGSDFDRRALQKLSSDLQAFRGPRRWLVQYVPHAFGQRSMNVGLVRWLRHRSRGLGDRIDLMVHEVAYPWVRWPWHHNVLALVHEWMMRRLVGVSDKVFVSTTAWCPRLRRLGARPDQLIPLPIPSNMPAADRDAAARLRASIAPPERAVVGHFGTYGQNVQRYLTPIVEALLDLELPMQLHFIGRGSHEYIGQLAERFPDAAPRLSATGRLGDVEIARHIAACDVMMQPFGDGANTRRTSLMACLINGRPVVATRGHHTESIWDETGCVALAPLGQPHAFADSVRRLIQTPADRESLSHRALSTYSQHFSIERTVATLLDAK